LKKLTHVAGTFVIHADASFLNGAGLGEGENRNVTVPKTLRDGKDTVPYVSSQAWKRWLRNTLIEETGWPASELEAIDFSAKGSVNKIAGKLDPVSFAEDDLFGYMRAREGQGKASKKQAEDEIEEEEADEAESASGKALKTKAVVRASPFSASLLISLRKNGWRGRDEGFVHLKEGTPLPYTTEFYTTHLQGIFCLAHCRVGRFENAGDRIELEEAKAKKYVAEEKLKANGSAFELVDAPAARKERCGALLRSLSVLRGGAKQAAFGTDVAPKVIVLAGLSCGNPVFNHLFEDEPPNGLVFNSKLFVEVVRDYADRIVTPVFIGMRGGSVSNEGEVRVLAGKHNFERGTVEVAVSTPREAAESLSTLL
jgi:CRISPR-associated protein Cst2